MSACHDFEPEGLRVPTGHFIGSEFVQSDRAEIEVLRPSDLQPMGKIPDGDSELVDRAVQSAKRAFKSSGWATQPPRSRARTLRNWAALIEAEAGDISRIEAAGSTRPIAEVVASDVPASADLIRYYAEYADKLEGYTTATAKDAGCLVTKEPYGVVAAIIPWNTPLMNAAVKIGAALAAGNTLVVKPSELTPFSLLFICSLANKAGIPSGVLNVVNGTGATAGAELVRHPDVRKVSFTGSTATGREILRAVAETPMKPVTLELGGKSPLVVFADCPNLERAAELAAQALTSNAGQICTCASRWIIEASVRDAFIDRVLVHIRALHPGATWKAETNFGPIINRTQLGRIEDLMLRTKAAGGRIIVGGAEIDLDIGGVYYQPTIVEGIDGANPGYVGEFFGPITTLQTFTDFEEAIDLADHPVYGLSASIFSSDVRKIMNFARNVEAGSIRVNQHGRAPEFTAPAGGFKGSGYGKDWGRLGLEAYLREKTIWLSLN